MAGQQPTRDTQEPPQSTGPAATPIQDFVRRLVTTIKPRLTVEDRSAVGLTLPLLQGLNDNRFGRLIVCCAGAAKSELLREEIAEIEVSPPVAVELRDQSALKSTFDGPIDLLVCSDDHERVVRDLLPEINPFGILLLRMKEGEHKPVREFLLRIEKEATMSVVLLPESLGLAMAQKRSERK